MESNHPLMKALQQIVRDIRKFIDLSLKQPDESWEEWALVAARPSAAHCWKKKSCEKRDCPAYGNEAVRCWLTAGTMCDGNVQGVFALKYRSCTECEVYQDAVYQDPATEISEHLITLVHSLRLTQDKLRTLATRDPLTGVFNRNFFNEIIMNEIQRAKRYGGEFSIVMLDIDNFKRINDHHGHLQGDRILKVCAAILGGCIRSSDLLVRFGGDEFLILTPGTDFRECAGLISRITEKTEAWNRNNALADCHLGVSAGCAMFYDGCDLMKVIKEADHKMYLNKQQHRRP